MDDGDDDGPPPFVLPQLDEHDEAAFGEPSLDDPLDSLMLPTVSRSPSPSRIPKTNGVDIEEKENDFDPPPPIKMGTLKDLSLSSSISPGGIESFLEREAIRRDDLPVDEIGLSPAVSRESSPAPMTRREEEMFSNGQERVNQPESLREEKPVYEPTEVDQSASEPFGNDDEDDDFGDFGFAPPPPPVDHPSKKDLSTVTEEGDDWAAFQSSSAINERKEEGRVIWTKMCKGYLQSIGVDDSDDWAAFEEAAAPAAERHPPVLLLPSLAELSIDEEIWSALDTAEEEDDRFAFDLYARLDADDPRSTKGIEKREEEALLVSTSLWLALRVVEEAAALHHTWDGSVTARHLYDLLQISATQPMQRAQITAAAAPSAGAVLQPTRMGEINGKSARAVTLSTSNSSISHVSNQSTSSAPTTSAVGATTTSTNLASGCLVPSTSSLSVSPVSRSPLPVDSFVSPPPVEFDWEKSNLKAPATQQVSSTSMLDMDYFAAGAPPKIISSDSTLQRDLDAFGLSATSASAGMPRVESTPSVLDSILSARAASAAPALRYLAPAELSLDARALHDSLPSLDHLAASWIAFPVRDNGDC